MRASLRNVLLSTATAIGMFTAGFSATQAANDFSTETDAHSLLGSYLAANVAKGANDNNSAATFYRSALALDPSNAVLLEQAFQTEAAEAHWDRAVPLARELVAKSSENRMAYLLLGINSFKSGNYMQADEEFRKASDGPIGELTAALARAWAAAASGNSQRALKLLDLPKQAEWAQFYLNYHKALIADVTGLPQEALAAYEHSMRQDSTTLRIALAYARHAARNGNDKLAKEILAGQTERSQGEPHVLVRQLQEEIGPGKKTDLLISTAAEGMAEVFYGLGEALTSEGGLSMGVLYLQLALYAQPDHAFALGRAGQRLRKRPALSGGHRRLRPHSGRHAVASGDRHPQGLRPQLARKGRRGEGDPRPAGEGEPDRPQAAGRLGNILRARKRYGEAVDVYSAALKLIPKPDKRHWSIFYSRGTCYERLKNWPAAEADLQKALELYPDQPLALNYLGYSWVDQNRNLKQGMSLIEKAVALKPDDGYIVDSLGWAHYKLGNFAEAVRFLERAVELKPQDPVLNDHLGDALWRVGREREAKFQWDQSLTLDPEPEEVEKIRKKLAEGMPPPGAEVRAQQRETMRRVQQKKRKETKLNPALVE